jgi:hypothetical protein
MEIAMIDTVVEDEITVADRCLCIMAMLQTVAPEREAKAWLLPSPEDNSVVMVALFSILVSSKLILMDRDSQTNPHFHSTRDVQLHSSHS